MGLIDYTAYRKQIERLYEGTCNVYSHEKVKDNKTSLTALEWVLTASNVPCYLQYSGNSTASESDVSTVSMQPRLYCAPEVIISEGDVVEVTQFGVTSTFAYSGKASVYGSHQEIPLEVTEYAEIGRR